MIRLKTILVQSSLCLWFLTHTTNVAAFPCYLTLIKNSCWTKYQVSVNVLDPVAMKSVVDINVPAGTSWSRKEFTCNPKQILLPTATLTTIFWQGDEGKVYKSKRYLHLPKKIKNNEVAWNITICYPEEFAEVPMPPDAQGNCHCDKSKIPAPKASSGI